MQPRLLILPAAALALNAATAVQCHSAAVDYFLKIDGIEGESADKNHKGEIELSSFSWGVTQSGTQSHGGGGGAGKVQLQDLHFTKVLDKATPSLFLKCATGQHIKSAVLSIVMPTEDKAQRSTLLTIQLQDILISGVQESANGGAIPADAVSIKFEKILILSSSTKGSTGGDVVTNAGE